MGLKIWLPLNGNVNNQGSDDITPVVTGAVVNNSGKIGKCYKFDGSDDYINLGDISKYFDGSAFSICFWIRSLENGTRGVIFSGYGLSSTSNFFSLEINNSSTTNNSLRFDWKANPDVLSGAGTIPYDEWVHIVVTYNGENVITVYKNGELLTQFSKTVSAIQAGNSYYLGRDSRTGSTAFSGYLNDFRLYDHCLSTEEIKHISQGLTIHYSLSNRGFGGDNLIVNSNSFITGKGATGIEKFVMEDGCQKVVAETSNNNWCRLLGDRDVGLQQGEEFTYSVKIRSDDSTKKPTIYFTSGMGYYTLKGTMSSDWSTFYYTGTWNHESSVFHEHHGFSSAPGTYYFKDIKLERGNRYTPWIPNSADALYSSLGLNSTAELDCSGYQYNGIKNNVTNNTDSPVNKGCYVFNGTNSWIKCDSNEWMVQGATELTINEWAYAEDWTKQTNAHLFSCTESGGFNTESAGSGYLRFPRHVYTNEAKSSSGYEMSNTAINLADLMPGWHMFTFVYNTSGDKIYIDGELYSSYDVVSYGLHFNTNARLYLGCEANSANPYAPYFNGKLSDFRLYYTELDEDEIKELYRMGK